MANFRSEEVNINAPAQRVFDKLSRSEERRVGKECGS